VRTDQKLPVEKATSSTSAAREKRCDYEVVIN